MQCYLALNREYTVAPYLTTVTNVKQRVMLTKYRLSAHSLAIETGRHKKSWLPKEERLCQECEEAAVETEQHFLRHCPKFKNVCEIYFSKFGQKHPHFINSRCIPTKTINGREKRELRRRRTVYFSSPQHERRTFYTRPHCFILFYFNDYS